MEQSVKNKKNILGDYILSFSVVVQILLVVIQNFYIAVFNVEAESTTIYRVIFSALPILFSFIYIMKRKLMITLLAYIISIGIVFFNILFYPKNMEFLFAGMFRFFFPILIPTFLAMISIRKIDIFYKVLINVSWICFIIAYIYISLLFSGVLLFSKYNMSLSYGLLIPMLILYYHNKKLSIIASFILFFIVLMIGSRGPALIFLLYVIYDMLKNHKMLFPIVIGIGIIFFIGLPIIMDILESYDIDSRTLSMLLSDNIDSDSGRGNLYSIVIEDIGASPILGIGLYGDRRILNGAYCHNIFLEVFLNWGIFIGFLFFIYVFGIFLISLLKITSKKGKGFLMIFFMAFFVPLLASGSYLESTNMAIFFGLLYFINKNKVEFNSNIK